MFTTKWSNSNNNANNSTQEIEMQSSATNASFALTHHELQLRALDAQIYDYVMDQSEAFMSSIHS